MKKTTSLWVRIPNHFFKILLFIIQIPLRSSVWVFLRLRFKIVHERKNLLPGWGKPYILLGDHVSYLDPFVISTGLFRPVRWIAADGNFRNPVMWFLMTFIAGAVCKTKNHSDMQSLKQMKLIAETGGIIGLFPEGEMSWDGVNGDLVQGTDKLVRFLKIPVVYCHSKGVFLSHPRWSRKARPRSIKLSFETIISEEEIEHLSLGEIRNRMIKAASYDDFSFQKEYPEPLGTQTAAEGMERFLFTCPECRAIGSLTSSGNRIQCGSCSFLADLDCFGFFKDPAPFESYHQWNLWQKEWLENGVLRGEGLDDPFWVDKDIRLFRGRMKKQARVILQGQAAFFRDRILFTAENEELSFSIKDITGLNVFKSSYVEFLFDKKQYRIDFTNPSSSGEKWEILFRLLMKYQNISEIN